MKNITFISLLVAIVLVMTSCSDESIKIVDPKLSANAILFNDDAGILLKETSIINNTADLVIRKGINVDTISNVFKFIRTTPDHYKIISTNAEASAFNNQTLVASELSINDVKTETVLTNDELADYIGMLPGLYVHTDGNSYQMIELRQYLEQGDYVYYNEAFFTKGGELNTTWYSDNSPSPVWQESLHAYALDGHDVRTIFRKSTRSYHITQISKNGNELIETWLSGDSDYESSSTTFSVVIDNVVTNYVYVGNISAKDYVKGL